MSKELLDKQQECAVFCIDGIRALRCQGPKTKEGKEITSNMEMYNERPTTIVEKRVYEENNGSGRNSNDYNRSTRERANAGLTLGIIGTVAGAAALWGRGGIGNLLGGGNYSGGSLPANVNINGLPAASGGATYVVGSCGRSCPTAFEAYEKSCDDAIALTNAFWRLRESGILEAQAARNTDVQEKFGLYSALVNQGFNLYKEGRDNLDGVNNRITRELFDLYKYTRDKDDETRKELCELRAEVMANNRVRPYQDKLIQCDIEKMYTALKNYVDRLDCRNIKGQLVLPNTPEVTGFAGYSCCNQFLNAAAAAGGAA